MQHEHKADEAKRRANAWIVTGACCIGAALLLLPVVAGLPLVPWRNVWHAVVVTVALLLGLLWIGAGVACIMRGRLMLMLGTPEEREQKKRNFQSRVAQAEEFLEMRPDCD